MSFFESFTFRWLRWRRPTETLYPLPSGVERLFVDTPGGKLEMLYAAPQPPFPFSPSSSSSSSKSPSPPSPDDGTNTRAGADKEASRPFMYFVHGGMGGAWVWLEYMGFLAARGVPCYAVSLRGHGASYYPSFLRMVYATTMGMLAEDALAGLCWVQREHGRRMGEAVLVGHSSGGGLCQLLLSEKLVTVKGLVLVASVPGYGS